MKNKFQHSRRKFGKQLVASAIGIGLVPAFFSTSSLAQTSSPLKIGIIGSGNIGGAVGLRWAEAGHEILFSSRNPDQLGDLVEQGGPNTRAGFPICSGAVPDRIGVAHHALTSRCGSGRVSGLFSPMLGRFRMTRF